MLTIFQKRFAKMELDVEQVVALTRKIGGYQDLGRRLLAAVMSFQLGRKGVDHELRHTTGEVSEYWQQLAERVHREVLPTMRASQEGRS